MCKLIFISALLPVLFLLVRAEAANETQPANTAAATSTAPAAELPTAEKLIRYRRQPPYAIIKRTTKRSKLRRRNKTPKIRYTLPSYQHVEPITHYKPSYHAGPSYSIDDFTHLKFDAADFKIPSTSYEAQSMDLDFYNPDDLYAEHRFPSLEYSFDGGGGGSDHEASDFSSYEHKPHQKYGVPPLEHNYSPGNYETPESYVPQHYVPPPTHVQSYVPPSQPPEPPATHYDVPKIAAPSKLQDDYAMYEQKLPNTGYHHNFAQPPKLPPAQPPNFDIAYAPPAYEINTSYQSHDPQYAQNTQQTASHEGGFAEPPAPPSLTTYDNSQPPAQSYPHEDYSLPRQELPLSHNHRFPSFDFPKSSYEVPIYDPVPFEASNKEEHESYPPIAANNGPDLSNNNVVPSGPQTAHADAYPASSLKTSSASAAKETLHYQRGKRKRLRGTAAGNKVSSKHTLDVPELQQAFETGHSLPDDAEAHESHYVPQQRKNPIFGTITTTTTTTAKPYTSADNAWSPHVVRLPTTPSSGFIPTVASTPATKAVTTRSRVRSSTRHRKTQSGRSSSNGQSTLSPATSVTIQKSLSQSYYDGTIAPPTIIQQFNTFGGHNPRPTRPPNGRADSVLFTVEPPGVRSDRAPKRTTKNVFDTTYFKSPHSDRELQRKLNVLHQILPKNHKLY